MASGKDRSCLGSLFSTLVVLVLVSALIHLVHALTLDKIIEYKKVAFAPAGLPSDLAGYRIAFITDTHLLPAEQLEEVIAELNQRAIDLLLLGGDFYRWGDLEATIAALARTVTSDGIYGIAGNHDNTRELFGLMEEYSIVPLSNSGVRIRQDFYLAGVEDLWNGSPDIPQAIAGSREGDFVLLLAHNPDTTMTQDTTGVDLVLSGHTHGGQVTIFGLWAPLFAIDEGITAYDQRFRSGWSTSRDDVPVYVSNGTGQYATRVFARPQVIILTLG